MDTTITASVEDMVRKAFKAEDGYKDEIQLPGAVFSVTKESGEVKVDTKVLDKGPGFGEALYAVGTMRARAFLILAQLKDPTSEEKNLYPRT